MMHSLGYLDQGQLRMELTKIKNAKRTEMFTHNLINML